MNNVKRHTFSVKKIVTLTLLALVCVIVSAFLIRTAAQFLQTASARSKVAIARQREGQIADQQLSQELTSLQQSGVISKEIARSKVDVCYTNSEDSGFVPHNWYQACYLRY